MGIISEFLNIKQQLDDYREHFIKTNRPVPLKYLDSHYLKYGNAKKKLFESAEKLLNANEPLDRDEVLELAQSLHGLAVGANSVVYVDKVKVEYFLGNESYRLTILPGNFKNEQIKLFEVVVSSRSKDMEITVQIQESEDIIKSHRLNSPTIHTNIKELKNFISNCNSALYLMIYLYLIDVLSEMV